MLSVSLEAVDEEPSPSTLLMETETRLAPTYSLLQLDQRCYYSVVCSRLLGCHVAKTQGCPIQWTLALRDLAFAKALSSVVLAGHYATAAMSLPTLQHCSKCLDHGGKAKAYARVPADDVSLAGFQSPNHRHVLESLPTSQRYSNSLK